MFTHVSVDYFLPHDLHYANIKYDGWNFDGFVSRVLKSECCLSAGKTFFVLFSEGELCYSWSLLCQGVISLKSLNTWIKDQMKRSVPPLVPLRQFNPNKVSPLLSIISECEER